MTDWLPDTLRPRSRWGIVGIVLLAAGFSTASILLDVPAPVWVSVAAGIITAWAVWIDAETFRLPDALTAPLFAVAIMHAALAGQDSFVTAVFGGVLGYAVMRLAGLYMDWRLNASHMMLGDAKFMAGLGALVGWETLPILLVIASLSGLAEGCVRLLRQAERSEIGVVPYGPHLAFGFACVWLLGENFFLVF